MAFRVRGRSSGRPVPHQSKTERESSVSHIYDSQRPYQRKGAHFMAKAGSALLADQPGLGKTIQTLASIIENATVKRDPKDQWREWHLIVSPKVAVNNVWAPEIRRWLRDQRVEILPLTGPLKDRAAALKAFAPKPGTRHVFVLVNIESMRIVPADEPDEPAARKRRDVIRFTEVKKREGTPVKVKRWFASENGVLPELFERRWDTVVCDESQRALIRTSHIPTQVRAGFLLVKSVRRVALSGTPMRGKPEQLWGTLHWLRPDLYTSYWEWAKEYYVLVSNGYSDYVIEGFKPGAKQRLARDLSKLMLRRTKGEVAPQLPPKTYAGEYLIDGDESSPLGVWLDMSPAQRKQYDRIETEGLIGDSLLNGTLAEYTRRRQVAGCYHDVEEVEVAEFEEPVKVILHPTLDSPKYEWLCDWLEQADGAKVVVVSQFTSIITVFAEALKQKGYNVVSITGKVSEKRRERAVKEFQEGNAQVFFLNVAAGGVALTLDAADYMVFLDETSIPDDQEQAEDRIHRLSRVHNVVIYYLRMRDSIEEEVAYIAAARQDVQQYLLDGARGIEYAKSVYLEYKKSKESRKQ